MTSKPLRILMILHMPWKRELGAPRFSLETAEEFEKLGHIVDKFDIRDAFPHPNRLSSFFEQALFARRAVQFVRQHGHRYDVIQAEQGNLPVSKQSLKFSGALTVRSNGLAHFYQHYERERVKRRRADRREEGTLAGNLLRTTASYIAPGLRAVEDSFNYADLILLSNEDERKYVTEKLGQGNKAVVTYNGLTETRYADFGTYRKPPDARLESQQVVFIGHWGERKGSRDLPRIVRSVRLCAPHVKFMLLGTGAEAGNVLPLFDEADQESVTIQASYLSADLPRLLSEVTVGILPSYIEGFPYAVLEQLAAAVPTMAYDVPGPRDILKKFDMPLLTPPGDIEATGKCLCSMLALSSTEYTRLSEQSRHVASQFRWSDISASLIDTYRNILV